MVLKNRMCPRCHGYLHANRDIYGEYRECLQCGHMEDIGSPKDPSRLTESRLRKDVA